VTRREIEFRLTKSLEHDLARQLPRIYAIARRNAARVLRMQGEEKTAQSLPEACPYDLRELLDSDRLPSLAG
jgi:hypothetical protein